MPSQLTAGLARETIAALAPAARAFERAKTKGYVQICPDQGTFWSHESDDMFRPAPPKNPNQMRLI
jgi:hypothetical protein